MIFMFGVLFFFFLHRVFEKKKFPRPQLSVVLKVLTALTLSSSLREPQGSWQSPAKRANHEIPTLANARSG